MSSGPNEIANNIVDSARLFVNEKVDKRIFAKFYDLEFMKEVVSILENRNDHLGVVFSGCNPVSVSVMLPKGN